MMGKDQEPRNVVKYPYTFEKRKMHLIVKFRA